MGNKRQTTFAKMDRERALRERRERKKEKKDAAAAARKARAAGEETNAGDAPVDDTPVDDEVAG
jgi:hypothetical protein